MFAHGSTERTGRSSANRRAGRRLVLRARDRDANLRKVICRRGINAMIFDYRNLGVSDGDNRQHLDPWAQIRDYQNAISFLERHEAVDPNRSAYGASPIPAATR